ncbi:MAG: inositol-3-phosphate synthase [Planctomycetota bacterium]|jgi:myo-inositol-1-phosphate synthase
MSKDKTGVWIFGAKGGLATTVMVGARAIAKGLTSACGLVTEKEDLAGLNLAEMDALVFGGHEIRSISLYDSAYEIYKETGSINFEILHKLQAEIEAMGEEINPGLCINGGHAVEKIADEAFIFKPASLRDAVIRIEEDIESFRKRNDLGCVIAVNLASTEPILEPSDALADLDGLERIIDENRRDEVRSSLLYAYAAIKGGCAYINFTPSNAALVPAIEALAKEHRVPYMGSDGKTGETLVKSALAPMFKYRNLKVLSWQGYNILGDRDGLILSDEDHRAAKVRSKDHLLSKILGYPLHTHVGIDFVDSLKDLKTAWDFIHFKGFMDFKMSMQFIWQGCDAILAAPLVLDMVRFADYALRKKEWGPMIQLSSFFKSPLGVEEHDLHFQFHALLDYLKRHLKTSK